MNELPQWFWTAITSVIVAVIGFLAGRRLTSATVEEKGASTLSTVTAVADSLARQLREVEAEVPKWKRQIASHTQASEDCREELNKYKAVADNARIIVEELSHVSYMRLPDEEETKVEKRLRAAKEAAARIAALKLT